jgi:hypothetical protein
MEMSHRTIERIRSTKALCGGTQNGLPEEEAARKLSMDKAALDAQLEMEMADKTVVIADLLLKVPVGPSRGMMFLWTYTIVDA